MKFDFYNSKIRRLLSTKKWRVDAINLKSRINAFSRVFKSNVYKGPDDLFFSIEELPISGKEYWFMHLCVPGKKEQVVLTFGRAQGSVTVNRTHVKSSKKKLINPKEGEVCCAALCWLYDSKLGKKVVLDSNVLLKVQSKGEGKLLVAERNKKIVSVRGHYPNYYVSVSSGSKSYFKAKVRAPTDGMIPYEIVEIFKPPVAKGLGVVIVNYYFDFSGMLNSKKVKGKAYLQKVIAAIPFTPWNWIRIQFESGSTIDFFVGRPFGKSRHGLHVHCVAFFEHNGKRYEFKNLKIKSWLEGKNSRWLLHGDKFYLAMKSYALQAFLMKTKTTFKYNEYLVEAVDFAAITKKGAITLEDVGKGSGIVEDASGYLL
ncbi:MAG: hypothetical protein ABIH83_01770 [Candidatus Micrarchaeota archaeon]